jgi:hypothetical protein
MLILLSTCVEMVAEICLHHIHRTCAGDIARDFKVERAAKDTD